MALVFQYGSNTLMSRLNSPNKLKGGAKFILVVRTVHRYSFDFTVWSKNNKCAAADLLDGDESQIYGVLYDIPEESIYRHLCKTGERCLDQIEGEGGNYKRIKIEIENLKGEKIKDEVLTYIVNDAKRNFEIKTSTEYVSDIISGLKEVKVPEDYIAYIRKKAKLNNDNLEI